MRCPVVFLIILSTAFAVRPETVSVCKAGPIDDTEVQIWLDTRIGRKHECSEAIEEIAVVKLLAREAQQQKLDEDPVVARKLQMMEAAAWSETAQKAIEAAAPPPTADEIAAYAAERGRFFERPAGVRLRWIFRIAGADDATAQAEARVFLEDLRKRILEGDLTFEEAARLHSQSESRFRDGLAGWISASQISPELAEIVFALDEGEVSEVITSSTGQNLFRIDTHVAASGTTDIEKRERARELLVKKRGEQHWETFREEVLRTANPRITLENLTAEDSNAVVLQLADGKKLTKAQTNDLEGIPLERAANRLTKMAFLMSIPEVAAKLGCVLDDDLRIEYELRRARMLATEVMSRLQNQETAPPTAEAIEAEWRLNRPKYRSNDRYRLWRAHFDLRVEDAIHQANQLRDSLRKSDSSPKVVEGVGTTESWLDRRDLIEMGPVAAKAIRTTEDSSVLGPFRNSNDLWLIRVFEHQAGRMQPLEEVSATIQHDLETKAREAIFSRVYQERLAQAALKEVREPSCSTASRPSNPRITKSN